MTRELRRKASILGSSSWHTDLVEITTYPAPLTWHRHSQATCWRSRSRGRRSPIYLQVVGVLTVSVEPFPDHAWGYSVVAPGLGSLDHPDYTTRYVKSIWDFDGPFTSSRHVPGVRFVGRPHPGVVGTAPSHELLRQWNERESRCVAGDADLPCRNGAYVGQTLQQDVGDRIYAEGARTSPAREHGGNIDIGGLVGGSKLYLVSPVRRRLCFAPIRKLTSEPVYVPGAKLSFGDCHFSIGDGEPTTAIEMAGIVTFKVNILPARAFKISSPAYLTSPSKPQYGERLVFTGLSASGDQQSSMDGMTAYRNAAFQAIDHLVKHGFSREQAYILLAVAPIETRIVATANRPNMTVSLGLPLGIFDVDIRPRDSSLY